MAKVNGPLFSVTASGQFGHALTYDKRGWVRNYVVPANPKTVAQMTVRNILGDIQRELKTLGTKLRGELKLGLEYRWNSVIIEELMKDDHAKWDALATEYNAFIAGDKTAWATADIATGLVNADGQCLYAVAQATFDVAARLGATITLTDPASANSATVGAEWIAAA